MSKGEIESKVQALEQEAALLRRRFNELQDFVQNAPGSHRPGTPSRQVIDAEREVQSIVLALVDIERKRVELNVATGAG